MGLDASIYKRKGDGPREEVHYWRKNGALHRVMELIFRRRGGKDDFNCVELPLDAGSLREVAAEARRERWIGWRRDARLFEDATGLIADGYAVVYDSWW